MRETRLDKRKCWTSMCVKENCGSGSAIQSCPQSRQVVPLYYTLYLVVIGCGWPPDTGQTLDKAAPIGQGQSLDRSTVTNSQPPSSWENECAWSLKDDCGSPVSCLDYIYPICKKQLLYDSGRSLFLRKIAKEKFVNKPQTPQMQLILRLQPTHLVFLPYHPFWVPFTTS